MGTDSRHSGREQVSSSHPTTHPCAPPKRAGCLVDSALREPDRRRCTGLDVRSHVLWRVVRHFPPRASSSRSAAALLPRTARFWSLAVGRDGSLPVMPGRASIPYRRKGYFIALFSGLDADTKPRRTALAAYFRTAD